MDYAECRSLLEEQLSQQRCQHSLRVSITAKALAKRFGVSAQKAELAGLLHDCARVFPIGEMVEAAESMRIDFGVIERAAPILLHAHIGAALLGSRYKISDPEIIRAVRLHTTGGARMSKLDKIIYLADMVEPGRDFPEVHTIRRLAEEDLDQALLAALNQSVQYIVKKNQLLHPDTIAARNEILLKG